MATYAIGDVQGCYDALRRLLDRVAFDPAVDQIWFTGDIVNRGPQSLAALRFVRELGSAATTVLGNHDLHLLAVYHGAEQLKSDDTLRPILEASDACELMAWLCHRPLLHEDPTLPGYVLIHAGLAPQWDPATARAAAREVETLLRGGNRQGYFDHLYGDQPERWDEELTGWERLRFITNALTRLRFCHRDGRLALDYKGTIGDAPDDILAWFRVPDRPWWDKRIVFGHWSQLGYYHDDRVLGLDTGCLWGGSLTAVQLGDETEHRCYQVDCGEC